jgi:hypothetical protein
MLTPSQVFISASPTVTKIVDVPPGPCTVLLSAIASGAAVSVGTSLTGTTSTNGALVNAGQTLSIPVPPGCAKTTLYGVGVGGTAIIGVMISAPN